MKFRILLILLFTTALCDAQTKVIAHKSHSGSNKSFSKAYKNNSIQLKGANFGLPGNMNILVLDSVIAINDSVTVLKLKESNICYPYGTNIDELGQSDFKSKSDTLVNHAVFNRKNTITFIKASQRYYYPVRLSNLITSVIFVGFKE